MILETQRLILREMTQEDLGDLCEILQDPVAMTAYEHAFSLEEVEIWLDRQRERYRRDGVGLWAAVSRETGELVGQVGLTYQDIQAAAPALEVGYLLKRRFWRQGYATEAARGCKRYAFDLLGADAVVSVIRDTNAASQAVARRNGMRPVSRFIKHYYGVDMPHDVYRITREEDAAGPIEVRGALVAAFRKDPL